jgi:diguanylate cyclase (GGDEF)-like protein
MDVPAELHTDGAAQRRGERPAFSDAPNPDQATDQARIAALLAAATSAADRDVNAALDEAQAELDRVRASGTPGNELALADAQLRCGLLHHRAARYDLALSQLRAALDLFMRQGRLPATAAARRTLGHVHDELGEYAQALAEHLHALALDEACGNQLSRAITLRTIGIIYSKAGDPEQGLMFYRESLDLSRRLDDNANSARTLNNVGINLKNLGRLEESRAALEEAHALFEAAGSQAGMASTMSNLALTFERLGDRAAAEAHQRRALAVARAAGYALGEVNALRGLGEVLLALHRNDEAQIALREALAAAESMRSRPEQARCHRALVDLYKARDDAAAALSHFEAFHAIERELFSEASDRKLRALQVGYQVAQLTRQSAEDALTGLANRRQLDLRLAEEFGTARSRGRPLAMALVDVDDFKQVNDRWSHAMGDAVLRAVARLLREHCRDADLVARYGGEEFALLLPATDAAGAQVACEKLRAALAAHDWNGLAPGLRITVSIGVADDSGAADVDALLAAADAQLYAAKRGGKNQVRA